MVEVEEEYIGRSKIFQNLPASSRRRLCVSCKVVFCLCQGSRGFSSDQDRFRKYGDLLEPSTCFDHATASVE